MSGLRILTSWPIRKKLSLLLLFIFLPAAGAVILSGLDHRHDAIREAGKNALLPAESLAAPQEQVAQETLELTPGDLDHGIFKRAGTDGINRIYAFKRLHLSENSPPYLFMSVGFPKEKIVQKANIQLSSNLSVLGIAALSAMLLAWLLGNFTFAAPINQLVAAAQLFARGELGTRTGLPHTPGKFGQLAKSFDEMASLVETRSSERDQAEQALRESEVRYRTLFESATDAIFLVLDNKFIDCNDAALKMFGCKRKELIGNYFYDFSPSVQPTGRDSKEEAIQKMANAFSGTPQFFEWRYCRRDETPFDAEVSLNRMELGNEILILGIVRDITSRKQAEKVLQESAWFQQQLIDALPAPVFFKDPEGRYLGCNKAYESFLNMGRDEIIGKSVFEIAPEELAAIYHEKDLALFRSPGIQIYESSVRDADGSVHNVVFHKATFSMGDGSVGGVIGAILDITERKRAEEALKEGERKFRAIFDQTFQFMGLLTIDGRLIEANRTALQFSGVQESDVIGKPFWETPWWTHSTELQETLRAAVEKAAAGEVVRLEPTHPSPDGSLHCMDFSLKPLMDEDGGVAFLIAEARDINERRQAEEALHESELRLKIAMDIAKLVQWEYDVKTGMFSFDDQFYALYGTTSQHEGGPLMSAEAYTRKFIPPEESHLVAEEIAKALATKDPNFIHQLEHRIIRADGEERHIIVRYGVVCDQTGSVVKTRGANQDVTERKRAEEELKDSEQQLRSVIQGYPLPAFVIGKDHKVVYWNKALEEMSKIRANEVVGTDRDWRAFYGTARPCMADLLVDEATPEVISHWYNGISNKSSLIEDAYEATDFFPEFGGEEKWLHCTAAAIRNSQGIVVGAIETIEDITDRQKTEEVLRESENRYRAIFENTGTATVIFEEDTIISLANAEFEKLTGYARDEIENKKSWTEFVVKEDLERMLERHRLRGADAKATPKQYEFRLIDRHNQTKDCLLTIDVIADTKRRVASLLDITERRQAEDALISANRQLKDIIEFLPDATLVVDRDKKVIAWNRAMEEMTGVSKEEMIGKGDHAYTVPFYGDRRPQLLDLIDAPDEELESKYQHVTKKGGILRAEIYVSCVYGGQGAYVFCTGAPLFDAHGNRVGAIESIRDVTEQRQAEEELKRSEERLKVLFECAPDPYYLCDLQGNFLDGNKAAQEAAGYKREELIGKNLFEANLLLPEDIPRALALLARNRLGYPSGPDEFVLNRKDGKQVFLEVRAFPTVIREQHLLLFIARDITNRKKAEEELIESHQQLWDIIDFLPDATLVIDKEGKVIAWNRAIEEMTGTRAADMLGKGNYEYALPFYGERRPILIDLVLESRQEIEQKYAALKRTDRAIAGEAYIPALRGGEVYLRGTASALFDSKGNVVGAIESIRDITERKHMQETLVEAEAKYRGIFENSVMGIFQVTPEGRFLSLNMASARILGYDSPEEALNTISDISRQLYVNPAHRYEAIRQMDERGMAQDFEMQVFRKDKSVAWITINSVAVHDINGKIIRMEGTAQDITERKRLASQLNQAHKMEAIGTLAGGIAHDFNNILMPIIGYAELSLNAVPKDSRLHHNMEQILLSGNRAKELVKQILTFSRKTEQEHRPVQVSLLVKETIKLLRSSLPSTLEIRQDIDEGAIYATTMADPTQIHQVLMNLCTNASHAMRGKAGVLSITLENVDIDSVAISEVPDLAPGPYLRLSVSDTGHGMDEAVRQRIFEPYFTTKGPSEGTGLGLALVYGIITSLSGGIAVFSEPGQGATFDVYFPRTKTLQAPMVEALEPLPIGKGLVLVVDDEKPIVDMLKEMLECLGYDVAERYGSYDALQAFRSRADSFDLVITDLTMPHMTGIDLAREILKIRPDTPIILCTGFSEAVDENWTKRVGIKGFLMKPIDLRDLATTVNKILFQDKSII